MSEPLSIVPYLQALNELKGSDLHCKVGSPPRIRIDGRLRRLQAPDLTAEDTEHMVEEVAKGQIVPTIMTWLRKEPDIAEQSAAQSAA